MISRRKIGQFVIADDFLNDRDGAIQQIMSRVIIIRCEHLYAVPCFEYTAICDDFDEVPRGQMIPSYSVIVHHSDAKLSIEFKKL